MIDYSENVRIRFPAIALAFTIVISGICLMCSSNPVDSDSLTVGVYIDDRYSGDQGWWVTVDDVHAYWRCSYNHRMTLSYRQVQRWRDSDGNWHTSASMYFYEVVGVTVNDTTWTVDCRYSDLHWTGAGTIIGDQITGFLRRTRFTCNDDTLFHESELYEFSGTKKNINSSYFEYGMPKWLYEPTHSLLVGNGRDVASRDGQHVWVGSGIARCFGDGSTERCLDNARLSRIVAAEDCYVTVGYSGIYYSGDGCEWEPICNLEGRPFFNRSDVEFAGERFVVIGSDGSVMSSTDGNSWTQDASVPISRALRIVWTESQFIIAGSQLSDTARTAVGISTDGVNWTCSDTDAPTFADFIWDGTRFIGLRFDTVWTSADAVNWGIASVVGRDHEQRWQIANSDTLYVLVGSTTSLYPTSRVICTSPDLVDWTIRLDERGKGEAGGVRYQDEQFLITWGDEILSSRNGIAWTQVSQNH